MFPENKNILLARKDDKGLEVFFNNSVISC